ncbi:MAG: regulatory protein RecX [Candidatus Eisenbacteria sp.]|nr:regulatory protein RecX [Candidatus Eisenbacteria bacterium]
MRSRPREALPEAQRQPETLQAGRARLQRDVVRFLRVRERTRQEVARYLTRRGHAAERIAPALEELTATRLVDDRRFAGLYLRDRQRLHPLARRAVLRELIVKGVARELAVEALANSDPPWDDMQLARAALERRWVRWPVEQRWQRGGRFLASRGFDTGVIREVLEVLTRESPQGDVDPPQDGAELRQSGADRWPADVDEDG